MLNRLFIINYLQNLTHTKAINLSKRIGVSFSNEEIEILLPYLKKNINEILSLKYPKRKIHTDLKNKVSMDSINKLYYIMEKLKLI